MPGWYTHLDVARIALQGLKNNAGAAPLFAEEGPTAAELRRIAIANSSYTALGAVGPDLFFLMPDFRAAGTLWCAAHTVHEIYEIWDENVGEPLESTLGPVLGNAEGTLNALSGGLLSQWSRISARGFALLEEIVLVLLSRQYDLFSVLGSAVPYGYDEKAFFWSDMLHYRKTYEFPAALWKRASEAPDPWRERLQAYALGWISHLAADVTAHSFVNEKCGGPYRLHWQRHHLIENHIDSKIYLSENAERPIYHSLNAAALHLWFAFNPDGTSRTNMFRAQPNPSYPPGNSRAAAAARNAIWDYESRMPPELADLLAKTLRDVYHDGIATDPKGPEAAHPTVLEDYVPHSEGFVRAEDIRATYEWLYQYAKRTTTDLYQLTPPDPPEFFTIHEHPLPPGAGRSDPGPRQEVETVMSDILLFTLGLLAWFLYLGQLVAWGFEALAALIASGATYPIRLALYEYVELPLYNAWASLHWYLAMIGFVYPTKGELQPGLVTLGESVTASWSGLALALADPRGGLGTAPAESREPSGRYLEPRPSPAPGPAPRNPITNYPLDLMVDPPLPLTTAIDSEPLRNLLCGAAQTPSEYLRPWRWPALDNQGHPVFTEEPQTIASPYRAPQDASILVQRSPGHSQARQSFEQAASEAQTLQACHHHLPLNQHLGGPVDYSAYLIAKLTRTNPGPIVNFNADADRGYGYLCWDWRRSDQHVGVPTAWAESDGIRVHPRIHPRNPDSTQDTRPYRAPLRAGAGWCPGDLAEDHPNTGIGDPPAHAPNDPSDEARAFRFAISTRSSNEVEATT